VTFKLPSLLYKSALIQQEIEAEQQQTRPDWLRVMRLKALRLKLMDRLSAMLPPVTPRLHAGYAC
jgi:hypothetical protein